MEWWNGLEWNGGMDWNGMVEWIGSVLWSFQLMVTSLKDHLFTKTVLL